MGNLVGVATYIISSVRTPKRKYLRAVSCPKDDDQSTGNLQPIMNIDADINNDSKSNRCFQTTLSYSSNVPPYRKTFDHIYRLHDFVKYSTLGLILESTFAYRACSSTDLTNASEAD